HSLLQPGQDVLCRFHSGIRREETRFELFERRGVDLPTLEELTEVAREKGIAAVEARAQATEEALLLLLLTGLGFASEHSVRILAAKMKRAASCRPFQCGHRRGYGCTTAGFSTMMKLPRVLANTCDSACISVVVARLDRGSMIEPWSPNRKLTYPTVAGFGPGVKMRGMPPASIRRCVEEFTTT